MRSVWTSSWNGWSEHVHVLLGTVFISWSQSASQVIISLCRRALWAFASSCSFVIKTHCDCWFVCTIQILVFTYLLTYLPYLTLPCLTWTKTSDTLTSASKTDVTPATLSHDFVAPLYRAIMSQRATVQLHAATLSRKQIKQTWLITIFLLVV